jgi:hypothetical protein
MSEIGGPSDKLTFTVGEDTISPHKTTGTPDSREMIRVEEGIAKNKHTLLD